jgi:hypothetical protein
MDITEKIQKEIAIYCKANGIDDVNGFLNGLVVKAFNIENMAQPQTTHLIN